MKKLVFYFMLICIMTLGQNMHAQSNSTNQSSNVKELLLKFSYHEDLTEYKKAKEILEYLVLEKSISDTEIQESLNEMLVDPRPIKTQYFVKFHNLPVFIDTGNPDNDREKYKLAKNNWIINNPEAYNNLIK